MSLFKANKVSINSVTVGFSCICGNTINTDVAGEHRAGKEATVECRCGRQWNLFVMATCEARLLEGHLP